MVSFSTLIAVGLLCLVGGAILGALMATRLTPPGKSRDLEERLRRAEEDLRNYQQDVTQHFAQTSQLVNKLTHSYHEVYEHLANSALKLTTPAMSREILESANGQLAAKPYIDEEQFETPKDWAPSVESTLSEAYGLHDDDDSDLDAARASAAVRNPKLAES